MVGIAIPSSRAAGDQRSDSQATRSRSSKAFSVSIEALMAPRMDALLVLTAGDPHQATVIAQVMLQGSVDTPLEVGRRGAASRLEAGINLGGFSLFAELRGDVSNVYF